MNSEQRRIACTQAIRELKACGVTPDVINMDRVRYRFRLGRPVTYWIDGAGYRVLKGARYETAVDVTAEFATDADFEAHIDALCAANPYM
jgi:predicted membrane metal-binding protein